MKKYVSMKFVLAASFSVLLVSCGGAGKGIKKDTPDAQTSGALINEACESDYTEIPDEETTDLSQSAQQHILQAQDLYEKSGGYLQKKKYDRALSVLDEAYAKLLKIDSDERGGDSPQIEELRFNISKRVMEIYAMRNKGFKSTSNEIPIVLNAHVNREIKSLTTNERTFFVNALVRSSRYLPMITSKLKEAGIPAELAWLPLIESGFRTNAYSPARALGMWQFIASTGHRYGLKRDEYVDERMDPEKSTDAAIAYLKELHQMFGDWETVLASYNCGEGRVLRTIRGQNINYLDNFWDLYGRLPSETARYVPRFIATLHIVNNLKNYDLANVGSEPPLSYDSVNISRRVAVKELGRAAGLSECLLRDLNPELRHGVTPPSGYRLKVPSEYREKILATVTSIQEATPPRIAEKYVSGKNAPEKNTFSSPVDTMTHKVKKGETVSMIAKKYNVSAAEIMKANDYSKKTRLLSGSTVKIPVAGKRGTVIAKSEVDRNRTDRTFVNDTGKIKKKSYTVKKGDTLWTIAKKHDTTPEKIIALNKLSGSTLKAGSDILVASAGNELELSKKQIVSKSEAKVKDDSARSVGGVAGLKTAVKSNVKPARQLAGYRVKQGDNLFSIARQHNTSVDRILGLNKLPKDTKIYPGQKLDIE